MGVQLLFLLLVLPCLHAARLRGTTLQPLKNDSSNALRGSRQSKAPGANQALGNQARNAVVTPALPPPKPPGTRPPPPSPPPTPPRPRRTATAGSIDKGEEGSPPPPKRSATPPPPPTAEQDSLVDPAVLLEAHNAARMLTGAANLTWSSSLANSAQDWSDGCVFQHSRSGAGENIALGAYRTPMDLTRGVGMWVGELCNYDFNNPGFGMNTGHWTQVVWRNTRQLGCGYRVCPNGVDGSGSTTLGVLVCQYSPSGNYPGAQTFRDNVFPASPMPSCAGKGR
ncbi:Protein PRY1 [Tetrabaena socialis]|uniref:Protein PRY1 n=1 Tax=Tetrabaena socialis TaxID=47790 RepID=A0A2J8AK87_9CHLO|nr:Protein PRY1 [Tetrabaena socialis]|eukprot:PNH12923.1 Protein PRY1 [Tetrabaena socialis]